MYKITKQTIQKQKKEFFLIQLRKKENNDINTEERKTVEKYKRKEKRKEYKRKE